MWTFYECSNLEQRDPSNFHSPSRVQSRRQRIYERFRTFPPRPSSSDNCFSKKVVAHDRTNPRKSLRYLSRKRNKSKQRLPLISPIYRFFTVHLELEILSSVLSSSHITSSREFFMTQLHLRIFLSNTASSMWMSSIRMSLSKKRAGLLKVKGAERDSTSCLIRRRIAKG